MGGSRKRRRAREWMAAKSAEVERERELVAWLRRTHREEVLRLTSLIAGDERHVYPQELSIETVLVEAVPMALPLPDGRSVGWFAWRILGRPGNAPPGR